VSQFHFEPSRYDDVIREIPGYFELQEHVAAACEGLRVERMLELGTGTGETTRRVRSIYPEAALVGIDESEEMLREARLQDAELLVRRIEEPLPAGPFDLVFTALAVHHLDGVGKAALFRRVAGVLSQGGRFVLGDVVIPERPEDAVTPLTSGFDVPDRVDDQLRWLEEAGLRARLVWAERDLAVLAGDRPHELVSG
jgi:tRNA (cmo5U34)-methyltransferase